eukprot:TRINITY_DN4489_c0_g1_i4.p1 TRINITY_DN4489_c0_g1~~TRINITY_DN4489_c0_g1_i4.p1  ORF type:complete len:336 (+),score=50.14 TRINITY_DN4489_c0_g1_i4:122-1129(+)
MKRNNTQTKKKLRDELRTHKVTFRSALAGDQPATRVLCYGDSLTAGFCSHGALFEPYGRTLADVLGAAGVASEVIVCGHSGGLASDFVDKKSGSLVDVTGCHGKGLARILVEDGPFDLVIIMAGTNDLGAKASSQAVLRSVTKLHEECHKRNIPTVALAPPPAPIRAPGEEWLRRRLCNLLKEWAAEDASGFAFYQEPGEFVPSTHNSQWIWEADGLHFTPAGSRALGEQLAGLLLRKQLLPGVGHARLAARQPSKVTVSPGDDAAHLVLLGRQQLFQGGHPGGSLLVKPGGAALHTSRAPDTARGPELMVVRPVRPVTVVRPISQPLMQMIRVM